MFKLKDYQDKALVTLDAFFRRLRMAGLEAGAGTLQPGAEADITVLADERGRWVLKDNEGTQVVAQRLLEPLFCLRAGVRFDAQAPILPVAQAA